MPCSDLNGRQKNGSALDSEHNGLHTERSLQRYKSNINNMGQEKQTKTAESVPALKLKQLKGGIKEWMKKLKKQ